MALILLEQPVGAEVPPLRAVEEIVEAGGLELLHLLEPAAQGLSGENDVLALRPPCGDDLFPDGHRHLVGRIAAEAAEAERDMTADQVLPIVDDLLPLRPLAVVDFGE